MATKISAFVLLVCSTAYSREYHGIKDPAFHHLNTDEKNCICFEDPGPHIKVPDVINPQHHGMKRLVIYLYQDTWTKDMKMYIPYVEKQEHIPDLVFENGDTLKPVTFENVNTIFNVSPHKILIQPHVKLTPTFDEVNSVLNLIPQEQVPVKISQLNPNIWAEYQKQNHYDHNINSDITSYRIPQEMNQVNIPYLNQQIHEVNEWPSHWTSNQIESANENTNHELDSVNESDLKKSLMKILYENGIYITDKGILTKEGTISDFDNLVLRPILVGNTMKLDNILQNDRDNLAARTPYTEAILVAQTNPSKVLGTLELGKKYLPLSILSAILNLFKDAHESLNLNDITHLNDLNKVTIPYEPDSINNMFYPDAIESQSRARKFENDERNNIANKKSNDNVAQEELIGIDHEHVINNNSENYVNINGNSNSLHRSLENVFKKRPHKFSDIPETNPIDPTEKDVIVEEDDNFIHNTTEQIVISSETEDPPSDIKSNDFTDSVNTLIKSLDLAHNLRYDRSDDKQNDSESPFNKILSDISKHVKHVPFISDLINLFDGKGQLSDASRNLKDPISEDEYNKYLQDQQSQSGLVSSQNNAGGYKKPKTRGLYMIGFPSVTKIEPSLMKVKQPGGVWYPNIKVDSSTIDQEPYNNGGNFPIDLPYPGLDNIAWDFASRDGSQPQTISPDTFSAEDQVYDGVDEKDDDGDFRIIGGNAATGSGTPLNNKGRSGYVF